MKITLVAAVALDGTIGDAGGIPWKIPEDMKRFRAMTIGGTVIMGRRTYDSIGKPLPGRDNIIISQSLCEMSPVAFSNRQPPVPTGHLEPTKDGHATNAYLRRSVVSTLVKFGYQVRDAEKIFVIGGAQIYEQCLPHVDAMELTIVNAEPGGDTRFPYWTRDWAEPERVPPPWRVVSWEDHGSTAGPSWSYARLERINTLQRDAITRLGGDRDEGPQGRIFSPNTVGFV